MEASRLLEIIATRAEEKKTLPAFMVADSVKAFYAREIKSHIPNYCIRGRINAGKVETWEELTSAVLKAQSEHDKKLAKVTA